MGTPITHVHRIYYVNHSARHIAKLYVLADPQHVLKTLENSIQTILSKSK